MFSRQKKVRGEYREKFDVELFSATGVGVRWTTNVSLLKEVPEKELRFPIAFLEGIVEWCKHLTWNHANLQDSIYNNIAWVELYVDFVMSQSMHSPVKLPHHNPKKSRAVCVANAPTRAARSPPCLGSDVFTFSSAVKFLLRKQVILLPPIVAKATTSKMLGLTEYYAGLSIRPRLVNNLKAARWLQKAIIRQGTAYSSLNFVMDHIPEWIYILRGNHVASDLEDIHIATACSSSFFTLRVHDVFHPILYRS